MAETDAKPPRPNGDTTVESDASGTTPGSTAGTAEVFVASHDALFGDEVPTLCDACGGLLDPVDRCESTAGYGLQGQGVYLWSRGDETRIETVPLCASCASAIGMTALARWEIEEEEG